MISFGGAESFSRHFAALSSKVFSIVCLFLFCVEACGFIAVGSFISSSEISSANVYFSAVFCDDG